MTHSSHVKARSRLRPTRALTALSLAGVLAITGCSAEPTAPTEGPTGGIKDGGTLTIGIAGDPGNIDPTMAATLTANSLYNSMCEYLYQVNDDGVVYPHLAAEDAVLNEDSTVARVKLREGVLFQDGTPFNADAVKFTIDRYLTHPQSQRASELTAVTGVDVVDEYTVDVLLDGPTAKGAFDVAFTQRAGVMISPTAVEELGDEAFAENPVCVGPFSLESRVAQDSITLVRNEHYYAPEKVHLDRIIYRVITDSNIRVTNLRSGDLDAIESVSTIDVEQLDADAGVVVVNTTGLGFLNLEFNMHNVNGVRGERGDPGTVVSSDPRIRQALEYAIDREAINLAVFNGQHAPACGFMAPSSPLATNVSLACVDHDPDKARQLIAESGVATPIKTSIVLNQRPEFRRMAEMIQAMGAEVGFDIEIDVVESTASVDRTYAGDFEIYINSFSGRVDPDANITRFADSSSERSSGRYINPRVDELLALARSSGDDDERKAAYDEVSQLLKQDAPYIFLIRPANLNAHASDVTGIAIRANGTIDPSFAGFIE